MGSSPKRKGEIKMAVNENVKPLIRELYSIQEELRRVKKQESEIRSQVIEAVLDENLKKAGTYSEELGSGVKLKISVPRKVDIDKEKFSEYESELRQKGLIGESGFIDMKPSVKLTALNYMSDEDKTRFADMFVYGVGSPSVKFELEK